MAAELTHFDTAAHLNEPEDQTEFLAAALRTGDPQAIAAAIETVARALGISLRIDPSA
ncbi:DNA-binding protein [Novosphingobium mathurense]|uniref:Addiction module antidote protein n=1 Tax=Novosphingobium mathurense TaxID=428990 RepID=A0A1U6INX1_9SPHN|nr:hypothetical protein [Novosphingobium mathurense]SLK09706.1 hypothetical protein SAMN06295987_11033 [Novosphingobium mathurense]